MRSASLKNTANAGAETDTLSWMALERRLAGLGGALLLALASAGCKCGHDDREAPAAGAASGQTGEANSLFSGAPGADVQLVRAVDLRKDGVFLKSPAGWGGDEDHIDGLVTLSPNDQTAVVMVYAVKGAVTDPTIALWTKSARGSDVSFRPEQAGKVGKDGMTGKMANGMGKLAGKDAEFWRFVIPLGADENLLIIAAVQKEAELHRRAELIACLRSLYKN
jgi:hypothetical protein